jgi:hypothetical protein
MKEHTPERRSQARKPVRLPVKVRQSDGNEQQGSTRDLTSNGIFFYSDGALESGTKLELVVMLPPGLGLATSGWTLCQASVVRVEEGADGNGVGVAASLDRIELLPEIT